MDELPVLGSPLNVSAASLRRRWEKVRRWVTRDYFAPLATVFNASATTTTRSRRRIEQRKSRLRRVAAPPLGKKCAAASPLENPPLGHPICSRRWPGSTTNFARVRTGLPGRVT